MSRCSHVRQCCDSCNLVSVFWNESSPRHLPRPDKTHPSHLPPMRIASLVPMAQGRDGLCMPYCGRKLGDLGQEYFWNSRGSICGSKHVAPTFVCTQTKRFYTRKSLFLKTNMGSLNFLKLNALDDSGNSLTKLQIRPRTIDVLDQHLEPRFRARASRSVVLSNATP
ncbi:uncharacterized protein BCR38DRAFT_32760 [Pseudomassariella vexata]|uniref:Uncharacterized protein n=1 Tax=Pseudomassariella vexata TaxID=1141098 RepID=A0A1Y2DQ31_9PEZI|nr:uncharacterized protein BCR38DRAFT_32760 [Pseudomassariella vexata]ORY61360.1 hypothetical protein BCR38DRAFT_32760 [Pseudomassariella vexata]